MDNKEAISIITQIKGIITNDNSWSDVAKVAVKEAFDLAIKALEESKQGEWIPVSERLPEENGVYLVTLEYVEDSEIVYENDMALFVYSEKDNCNNGFHKAYRVIAWQPLPEPYEKGGAE